MQLFLKCKYTIDLVERFHINDQTYIVTKLAAGGNLFEYCLRQPNQNVWMSEKRAQRIFSQLAKGLENMHRKGVAHRDVKPTNILCHDSTDYPAVSICDFEHAIKLQDGEKVVEMVGTLAFMAPEVL